MSASNNGFLSRICDAMNMKPGLVARLMNVPYPMFMRLLHLPQSQLVELNRDEMWTRLAERVDRQIGLLLAVKAELARKLDTDRQKQLARRLAIETRGTAWTNPRRSKK